MNVGWLVFAACVVFVLAAALPLLKEHARNRRPPLPPRHEASERPVQTLRTWRDER